MVEERKIAVQARGVTKGFGSGQARNQVLRGIDLEVYCGELMLLVGPSGSGKTTLMTILGGMLSPDEGNVSIFGEPVEKLSEGQRTSFRARNLGFVFQQFNLIPSLTVVENAAVPLIMKGVKRAEAILRSGKLLSEVGLEKRKKLYPGKLSGGEQQRVAIVRALLSDPKILVCDEPTASLDGETGKQIMEIIRERARNAERSVIVVTHDNRIFHYGDRMARISDGRIVSVEAVQKN